jgi:TRAP-type C4-dicarboxylate transport system permease small subunit
MFGKSLTAGTDRVSAWMEIIAGTALIVVMALIGADIVGRFFGFPVPGTYEIVTLAGGLIIGMALPATSRSKGHVSADLLSAKFPEKSRRILNLATRLIGIATFLVAGCGMLWMGFRLKASGEVTAVLSLPFYYVVYAVGVAFLIQPWILLCEIIEAANPEPER